MIGKLLSTTIKMATLPIDIANSGMDMLCGGDGSKQSRNDYDSPLSPIEKLRDQLADSAEKIDKT